VIEQGAEPFVLAVEGPQVYVLTLNDPSDADAKEDIVSVRSMRIAPDSPPVELKTKLRGERIRDEPVMRSDTWSFTLPDGTPITIEVRVNPAGRLDPRAVVALKLAEAFGVRYGGARGAVGRRTAGRSRGLAIGVGRSLLARPKTRDGCATFPGGHQPIPEGGNQQPDDAAREVERAL